MNNPMHDLLKEIQWIGENRFDFIDLTLEPPGALAVEVDVENVSEMLEKYKLGAVGHTAYYLPIASPFPSFCEVALDELRKCFETFQKLDIQKVNLHPDESFGSLFSRNRIISRNIHAIQRVAREAEKFGLTLMIENSFKLFNSVEELQMLFEEVQGVGFHLDVGHANLNTEKNKTEEFLMRFHNRLEHVHLSDNKSGNSDLHLPLGAGLIPWDKIIKALKNFNYNGTITLEVFSRDRRYLLASREKLIELWSEDFD